MSGLPFDRIIVALCEGQHDVAFLSRLLLVNDFITYNKKIKEFPWPFSDRFQTELSNISIPDKKLGFQAPSALLPSIAFHKENTWVFLHNVGGDSQADSRNKLIRMYRELSGNDDYSIVIPYRFVYFFDSDLIGVDNRMSSLAQEIGIEEDLDFTNGSIIDFDGVQWGAYIFHNAVNQFGTLEDLILSYFDNKIPNLNANILSFLRGNSIPVASTRKIKYEGGRETYYGSSRYAEKKSIIGIYGQLQFSGVSNSSLLENTDFMRLVDFVACQHCQAIQTLFA